MPERIEPSINLEQVEMRECTTDRQCCGVGGGLSSASLQSYFEDPLAREPLLTASRHMQWEAAMLNMKMEDQMQSSTQEDAFDWCETDLLARVELSSMQPMTMNNG